MKKDIPIIASTRCYQCQAPLEFLQDQEITDCEFCGAQNRIISTEFDTSKTQTTLPTQDPFNENEKPSKAILRLVLFVGLSVIIGALLIAITKKPKNYIYPKIAPSQVSASAIIDNVYALKTDSDRMDFLIHGHLIDFYAILVSSLPSQSKRFYAIVDGTNGKIKVRKNQKSENVVFEEQIVCMNDNFFVAARANFEFHVYDAKTLDLHFSAVLDDNLASCSLTEERLLLTSVTGKIYTYTLPKGVLLTKEQSSIPDRKKALQGQSRPKDFIASSYSVKRGNSTCDNQTFRANDVTISVSARAIGTPMITVSATKNAAQVWSTELSIKKGMCLAAALDDGVVLVTGLKANQPYDDGTLIGIDATTGKILYTISYESLFHTKIFWGNLPDQLIQVNHSIYITAGTEFISIDSKTGNVRWSSDELKKKLAE